MDNTYNGRGCVTAFVLGAGLAGGLVFVGPKSSCAQVPPAVHVPAYTAPSATRWLPQNWSKNQAAWFHHADQGTLTFQIPYEWFVALQQPALRPLGSGLFADPAYLDRFGFIPDPDSGGPGEPGQPLPVGFARGTATTQPDGSPWLNPATSKPYTSIGLTCAACHTGRLTYKGTEILVDGGSALTNLGTFRSALGITLFFTNLLPFQFDKFADVVLGRGAPAQARAELHKQLRAVLDAGDRELQLIKRVALQSSNEGFGRLDALNRIGNTVFSLDLGLDENYAPTSAPVHYPRIWNSPWYGWVQYDGSIQQPMVRNAGEALGVSARVQLTGADATLFRSSVAVRTIADMERLIAGPDPLPKAAFQGLTSPKWPTEIFGPIERADQAATGGDSPIAHGARLYVELCQGCHLPPVSSSAFWASPQWKVSGSAGQKYLDPIMVPLSEIGTDPEQALGLATRTVTFPARLGLTSTTFGRALGDLVEKVTTRWYDEQSPPISPSEREHMNGFRQNGIRAPLAYKALPLNGIWATPPYLHNGSLPSLYALLSPLSERPKTFPLGDREYDPEKVGYRETNAGNNFFVLDTSYVGNSNKGHEFDDAVVAGQKARRPGVIGRRLSPEERLALIAYLKSL